ncbi:MAG TPA: DUF5666 domain-containing protein [Capsulimonadaceae bacterium]|nr:DUF5666 domain-containing protein [Capsulimonadaceae bacterium]
MRRLFSSCPFTLLVLSAIALPFAFAPAIARAQSDNGDNASHPAFHGEGYVSSVDPDRDRVGFVDIHGARYVLDTYSAQIDVPAVSTTHASTGDLVKNMRVEVDGSLLTPTIIEADHVRVLPYVAPSHPIESPDESAPVPAPTHVPLENAHIDLEGTVVSYHPMEQTHLDYDVYTVHVNDHDRNVRVGGPDVVRDAHGESLDGPLAPGDRIQVTGNLLESGDVQADKVTRLATGQFYPGQKHFEGGNVVHGWVSTQASFYSRDIKVRVRDTEVDVAVPGGIPVRENGHPVSVHDLGKHEQVTLYGQWTSDNNFRADRIEAEAGDDQ